MKFAEYWLNLQSRFNAMSARERAMIAVALLAVFILVWNQALMSPLEVRKQTLTQELSAIQQSLQVLNANIEGSAQNNPLALAMKQKQEAEQSLEHVDLELKAASAGLIPPDRMLDALRDVLASQSGVRLISMRNFPATSLIPVVQTANGTQVPPASQGPYMHSVELVIDGGYIDVLRYLERVEKLPWRFYWQILELKAAEYPLNRVRIRLSTLSMDKEWLGV